MRKMYDDRELVKRMGEKSRERALRDFNVKDITACWVEFYRGILGGMKNENEDENENQNQNGKG